MDPATQTYFLFFLPDYFCLDPIRWGQKLRWEYTTAGPLSSLLLGARSMTQLAVTYLVPGESPAIGLRLLHDYILEGWAWDKTTREGYLAVWKGCPPKRAPPPPSPPPPLQEQCAFWSGTINNYVNSMWQLINFGLRLWIQNKVRWHVTCILMMSQP